MLHAFKAMCILSSISLDLSNSIQVNFLSLSKLAKGSAAASWRLLGNCRVFQHFKSISAPAVSRGSKIFATADLSEVYEASYACVQQLFPPRFCLCRPTLLSLKSRLRADFQLLDTCLTLLRLRRWPSRCVVPCVLQDAQNLCRPSLGSSSL